MCVRRACTLMVAAVEVSGSWSAKRTVPGGKLSGTGTGIGTGTGKGRDTGRDTGRGTGTAAVRKDAAYASYSAVRAAQWVLSRPTLIASA
jgi:hypothetical protein